MRDYFAAILPAQVTGVSESDITMKGKQRANSSKIDTVTPQHCFLSDEGDNSDFSMRNMASLVGPCKSAEEMLYTKREELFPLSPSGTPNHEESRYFYEERAAIYQYEAGYTQEEAERLAYQETLLLFLSHCYASIHAEFEAILFLPLID
jgi:hypothetical protein